MKKLVVGILAYNEGDVIAGLLEDLVRQSVMKPGFEGVATRICVVPNGCSDDTAQVSRDTLKGLSLADHVSWDVTEVATPGKTNAWNHFVHQVVDDDADYILFLDADIRLPQQDIIERSLDMLEARREAWIVSDQAKNVFFDTSASAMMKVLTYFLAGTANDSASGICGQYYCARAERLKQITLPAGLLSQDGFIGAMVLTSALSEPPNEARVQRVPDAYHLHPAYTSVSSRFRFEKRQAMSTTVYTFIYEFLHSLPPSLNARMAEIKRLNGAEPDWVARLVKAKCADTVFPVPARYILKRIKMLPKLRAKGVLRAPFAIVALPFDFWVGLRASLELKSKAIGDTKSNAGRFRIRDS